MSTSVLYNRLCKRFRIDTYVNYYLVLIHMSTTISFL